MSLYLFFVYCIGLSSVALWLGCSIWGAWPAATSVGQVSSLGPVI